MKHVILTLGIFGLAFLTSCDNSTEVQQEQETEQSVDNNEHPTDEAEHPSETEEHFHDNGESLSLNEGEKWMVNEEMKPFVTQGEEFVYDFSKSKDEDYLSLANNLSEQNKQLISSCTMDGVSHDELHKWLHPHLELTKKLKNAQDIDEANHIVQLLLSSYKDYHKFFQ